MDLFTKMHFIHKLRGEAWETASELSQLRWPGSDVLNAPAVVISLLSSLPHLFVHKIALKLLLLDLDCSCLGQEQLLWCVCTGFSTNVLRPLRNDT